MGGLVRQLFRCQISLRHEVEERYCSFIQLLLLFIFIFLQVGKIKATSKRGLKILRINCQNLTLIKTNGIRKVREGVNIFDKRILDSCKFISDSASEYGLIYNNLFLAEYKLHGAQSIRILHVSKGGGREAQRNPSFSALLCSFLPSRVYCHVLFHTGFRSAPRNWRELYKYLTVLSFQIHLIELMSFSTSSDT